MPVQPRAVRVAFPRWQRGHMGNHAPLQAFASHEQADGHLARQRTALGAGSALETDISGDLEIMPSAWAGPAFTVNHRAQGGRICHPLAPLGPKRP